MPYYPIKEPVDITTLLPDHTEVTALAVDGQKMYLCTNTYSSSFRDTSTYTTAIRIYNLDAPDDNNFGKVTGSLDTTIVNGSGDDFWSGATIVTIGGTKYLAVLNEGTATIEVRDLATLAIVDNGDKNIDNDALDRASALSADDTYFYFLRLEVYREVAGQDTNYTDTVIKRIRHDGRQLSNVIRIETNQDTAPLDRHTFSQNLPGDNPTAHHPVDAIAVRDGYVYYPQDDRRYDVEADAYRRVQDLVRVELSDPQYPGNLDLNRFQITNALFVDDRVGYNFNFEDAFASGMAFDDNSRLYVCETRDEGSATIFNPILHVYESTDLPHLLPLGELKDDKIYFIQDEAVPITDLFVLNDHIYEESETPTYMLDDGQSMPPGMFLTQSGNIGGTPSAEGQYDVRIKMTNEFGILKRTFRIQVAPAGSVRPSFSAIPTQTPELTSQYNLNLSKFLNSDATTPIEYGNAEVFRGEVTRFGEENLDVYIRGLELDGSTGVISGFCLLDNPDDITQQFYARNVAGVTLVDVLIKPALSQLPGFPPYFDSIEFEFISGLVTKIARIGSNFLTGENFDFRPRNTSPFRINRPIFDPRDMAIRIEAITEPVYYYVFTGEVPHHLRTVTGLVPPTGGVKSLDVPHPGTRISLQGVYEMIPDQDVINIGHLDVIVIAVNRFGIAWAHVLLQSKSATDDTPDPAPKYVAPDWANIPAQELTVGKVYTLNLANYLTGENPTPTVARHSGGIPPGLAIEQLILSGTPTTAGTYTLTLRASSDDADSKTNTDDVTIVFNVAPAQPVALAAPVWQTISEQVGNVNSPFRLDLNRLVTGNPTPTIEGQGAFESQTSFRHDIMYVSNLSDYDRIQINSNGFSFLFHRPYFNTDERPDMVIYRGLVGKKIKLQSFQNPDREYVLSDITRIAESPQTHRSSSIGDYYLIGIVGTWDTNWQTVRSRLNNQHVYQLLESGSAVPDGLALSDGVLSGTPTTKGKTENTPFVASNSQGSATVMIDFNIMASLAAVAPTWATIPTLRATLNESFSYDLKPQVSGLPAPTIALQSGTLPVGMSITNGVLTGTPTESISTMVTLRATNSKGSDDVTFTIIVPVAGAAPLFRTPGTLVFFRGVPVSRDLATYLARGDEPVFYSVNNPEYLPGGIELQGSQLIGTPAEAGRFSFNITATNAIGSDDELFVIDVREPLVHSDIDSVRQFEYMSKTLRHFDLVRPLIGGEDILIVRRNIPCIIQTTARRVNNTSSISAATQLQTITFLPKFTMPNATAFDFLVPSIPDNPNPVSSQYPRFDNYRIIGVSKVGNPMKRQRIFANPYRLYIPAVASGVLRELVSNQQFLGFNNWIDNFDFVDGATIHRNVPCIVAGSEPDTNSLVEFNIQLENVTIIPKVTLPNIRSGVRIYKSLPTLTNPTSSDYTSTEYYTVVGVSIAELGDKNWQQIYARAVG